MTTDYVILEVGNYLSPIQTRYIFHGFLRAIRSDERMRVISVSKNTMDRGAELYNSRTDKSWSLTDCISFVVMNDENLREALTFDRDFLQAGFLTLPEV